MALNQTLWDSVVPSRTLLFSNCASIGRIPYITFPAFPSALDLRHTDGRTERQPSARGLCIVDYDCLL